MRDDEDVAEIDAVVSRQSRRRQRGEPDRAVRVVDVQSRIGQQAPGVFVGNDDPKATRECRPAQRGVDAVGQRDSTRVDRCAVCVDESPGQVA